MDSKEKHQDEIDFSVLERPLLDSSSNRTSEKKEKNSEEETNTVVSKGEFAKPSAPKVSDTHSVRSSTRMFAKEKVKHRRSPRLRSLNVELYWQVLKSGI